LARRFPVVAGLGNPGAAYSQTRHNVGFDIVDAWARDAGVGWKACRFARAEVARIPGGPWLIKPLEYMNLSGRAIRSFLDWYHYEAGDLLVVVDDVNLDLGRLRLRGKGSDGGHNGLKSVEDHLNTTEYARLRAGVGQERHVGSRAQHVLGKFTSDEWKVVDRMIGRAIAVLDDCEKLGLAAAQKTASLEIQ
jgi:PTH1 family peptidyl-tRNA hydrolase